MQLGALDLDKPDPTVTQNFTIIDIYAHPKYVSKNKYLYDIALFKLSSQVKFSAHVRPICLFTDADAALSQTPAIISGYGTFDESTYVGALTHV